MATRRAAEDLAARPTPSMPSDAVALCEGPREAWRWVLRGGLTPEEAQDRFGMRWHERTRRVIIPVIDGDTLVGLIGRAVFGERPKYVSLGGPRDAVYRLIGEPSAPVVVVEDILSAIAVNRAGMSAVAVLGTSISPVLASKIAAGASEVIGWFDGDKAGDRAWVNLRQRLALYPVELRRIRTKDDPKLLHRRELVRRLRNGA